MDDAGARAAYKTLTTGVLGILSLSLVLLPSMLSVVYRPYIWTILLWLYLPFLTISVALLAFAHYFAVYTEESPPHKSGGFGNLSAFIAMVCWLSFLVANLVADQISAPRITNLTANGITFHPGETVSLSGEGQDEAGGDLIWQWRILPNESLTRRGVSAPRITSSNRSAYWSIPSDAAEGQYSVVVTARDDDGNASEPHSLELSIRPRADVQSDSNTICEC